MTHAAQPDPTRRSHRPLVHEELTADILSAAFEVHNTLGSGLFEKVYENALAHELTLRGHCVVAQQGFRATYKELEVGVYYADIVVDSKVVIEAKAVDELTGAHRAQLLNYLRLSGLRVGLLLNFGRPRLKHERMVV